MIAEIKNHFDELIAEEYRLLTERHAVLKSTAAAENWSAKKLDRQMADENSITSGHVAKLTITAHAVQRTVDLEISRLLSKKKPKLYDRLAQKAMDDLGEAAGIQRGEAAP